MKRILTLLAMIAVMATACSYSNTDSSTMACIYNGGAFDSKDFKEYLLPGSGRNNIGMGSNEVAVPTRLLTYQVSLDPLQGDTPSADSLEANIGGMSMKFEPTMNGKFDTSIEEVDGKQKPRVCTFYETHLRAFGATDFNTQGGNWQFGFLSSRVRPSIDVAGVRVLQRFDDPIKMYFNTVEDGEDLGYRDRAADAFGAELSKELTKVLGGNYFCGPSHTVGSDTCGDLVVILPQPTIDADDLEILSRPQRSRTEANAAIAEAQEAARKAEQVAAAREIEAESAVRQADADEKIAQERSRTVDVEIANDYAWCAYVRSLGEECWKVKAAETGGLPQVLTDSDGGVTPTVVVD